MQNATCYIIDSIHVYSPCLSFQASKLEIPHYYLTVECEMDGILKLRGDINKTYEKEGLKLSVNDFVIKAVALAAMRVPQCNSAWMDTVRKMQLFKLAF